MYLLTPKRRGLGLSGTVNRCELLINVVTGDKSKVLHEQV
jgi:hypothetical protein